MHISTGIVNRNSRDEKLCSLYNTSEMDTGFFCIILLSTLKKMCQIGESTEKSHKND